MGKMLAILAAGAVAAGGATFAVFHHLNPYGCPLADCEVARMKCCAEPTSTEPTVAEAADAATAAAGPAGMFATVAVTAEVPSCCSLAAKPAAVKASCCAGGAACCAALEPCCPALTAAVGPAAAAR